VEPINIKKEADINKLWLVTGVIYERPKFQSILKLFNELKGNMA
jgi:hypothetical protein